MMPCVITCIVMDMTVLYHVRSPAAAPLGPRPLGSAGPWGLPVYIALGRVWGDMSRGEHQVQGLWALRPEPYFIIKGGKISNTLDHRRVG